MNSKKYLWQNMNKILLECPGCKKDGGIEILPWQSGPGVFGAVSIFCDHCEGFFILNLSNAKELKVAGGLPKLPE